MDEFSKIKDWIVAGGVTAILALFIWWKKTLHEHLVAPAVEILNNRIDTEKAALNSRIDFLENRATKLEDLYDRVQDNLEKKIDKLQDTVAELAKEVAELTGQLKAMREQNK